MLASCRPALMAMVVVDKALSPATVQCGHLLGTCKCKLHQQGPDRQLMHCIAYVHMGVKFYCQKYGGQHCKQPPELVFR